MGKVVKWIICIILFLLVMIGVFIAGDYFDLNIPSILGFSSNSQPHTADEVTDINANDGSVLISQENVPYVVEVDFDPVLLQEAQLEKKLIIMTQKASITEKAQKEGLWKLPVFKQTKAIIFHGEGTFFVDLSSLSSDNFLIDNQEKTITIYIPKPQFSVSLLPEETEFLDTSNGILRFGEMEITPEAMTDLEKEGKAQITETLETDSKTWDTAERFAKLAVKEMFEPLVKAQVDAAVQNAADEFAIPAQYTIFVEIKG